MYLDFGARPDSKSVDVIRRPRFIACACILLVSSSNRCLGAVVAADNASNSAYSSDATGAWKGLNSTTGENPPGTDNGGSGFLTWNFAGGYQQPQFSPYGNLNHFIDGVDFAASSFNNLGSPAFGLTNANFAFGGDTARATRSFALPLVVGNTLSLKFDNPLLAPLDPFAPSGFLFRLNTGHGPIVANDPTSTAIERFGLFTTSNFNSGRWYTTDLAGFADAGIAPSDTAVGTQFRFTLDTAETYTVQLNRLSDGAMLFSRTGSLSATGAGAIDCIEITLFSNGSGNGSNGGTASPTGERELFFNDLRITSPLVGDYNHNGIVDAADYNIWRDSLGASVAKGTGADGNSDGTINSADYDVWKTNFGLTNASAFSAGNTVPEASTDQLVVAMIGSLVCYAIGRRQGVVKS
jgi:hypothetical protein